MLYRFTDTNVFGHKRHYFTNNPTDKYSCSVCVTPKELKYGTSAGAGGNDSKHTNRAFMAYLIKQLRNDPNFHSVARLHKEWVSKQKAKS